MYPWDTGIVSFVLFKYLKSTNIFHKAYKERKKGPLQLYDIVYEHVSMQSAVDF